MPHGRPMLTLFACRHGHLMLFDDDEQLEVRHVISLTHHDVSIYSGGDVTPEGELFIKRNAICLSRRTVGPSELPPDSQISKPFYLFSENCSAKEDFYFALLRNQEQAFPTEERAARPLTFDVKNVISLVQKLHSSEEHLQSRWLNAMIGRLFLGLYKTADIEALIREKLTKKISRVKRPAFLSSIEIRKIDTGESAPFFTNLRHRDLTVEGECCMEADVKYTGNFRIEVAAIARLDLGARLKAREVNLVLSVALRKMEGHLLFKIKPPPSNRVWFSFSQMPKMEMTIEPIVSSRQITYTVILRQIEARIKEVVAETLVLPFWDDTPFFKTEHKRWRGGIFEGDDAVEPSLDPETTAAQVGEVDDVETLDTGTPPNYELPPMEKSQSMPVIEPMQTSPSTSLFGLKLGRGSKIPQTNPSSPTVESVDPKHIKADASSTSVDVRKETPAKQRPVRSGSFVGEPIPIVSTETVNADVFKPSSPPGESSAASAMARLSSRSKAASASGSPLMSPHRDSIISIASGHSNASSKENTDRETEQDETPKLPRRGTASSTNSNSNSNTGEGGSGPGGSPTPSVKSSKTNTGSLTRGLFLKRENTTDSASTTATGNSNSDSTKRIPTSLAAVSSAAGAARRWGLNALQRHGNDAVKSGHGGEAEPELDLSKPMGGGRPLPPPGIPLPMPDKKTKTAIPVPRRKPVAPPPLPERASVDAKAQDTKRRPVPPPPLPKRRRRTDEDMHGQGEDMLVVEAPIADSEPTSPLPDEADAYRHPYVEDAEEDLDPFAMDGSPGEDSSGTPPAKPSEESKHSFGTSRPQGEGATDDEYDAWMENTGEDEPPPEYVTSEGLTH